MLRQRAQQNPQIRLPRVDLRLQYRLNHNILCSKLKVTEAELLAITDMTRPCWSVQSDIPVHMQCAAALAYLTSNSHQHWLGSALGMSQATVSRKFTQLVTFLSSPAIVEVHLKKLIFLLSFSSGTREISHYHTTATGIICRIPSSFSPPKYDLALLFLVPLPNHLDVYGSVDGTIIKLQSVNGPPRLRHHKFNFCELDDHLFF